MRPILSILLIFLLTTSAALGQHEDIAVKQLKEQISKLEAIEREPSTPESIRILNRKFLTEKRAQLHDLLKNKLDQLRSYQTQVRSALSADQNEFIEAAIRALEADLRNLQNPSLGNLSSATTEPEQPTGTPASTGNGSTIPISQPDAPINPPPAAGLSLGTGTDKCPAEIFDTVKLIKTASGNSMRVRLAVPLSKVPPYLVGNALSIPTDQVVIITKPSNTIYTKTDLAFASSPSPPGPKYLTITLNAAPALPAGDTEATIMLNNLPFECDGPTVIPSVTATGKIFGKNNLGELADEAKKELDDAAASAKTSEERNIFAGFAAAQGESGDAAGDADISFNKTLWGSLIGQGNLFDKVVLAFRAKKSSAENADPRHFTTGITFRKTLLLQGRKAFNDQQTLIQQMALTPTVATLQRFESNNENLNNRGFFRALLIDETLNLEAEAFDFDTVNFVSDTQFRLASISKRLFGNRGFWNLRLIGGPEIGRNLNKPVAAPGTAAASTLEGVDWITRLKAGAQLTLRYLPTNSSGTNWGLELDLAFVNRRLFSDEVTTELTGDSTNPIINTVGKGNKSWRQADLRIFPFEDDKARYGFKLSYSHGRLPPAFTFTKGFQYGFVIQSKDDESGVSSKPANQ